VKKHIKLYNRIFAALHESDRFVIASERTHDEVVAHVANTVGKCMAERETDNWKIAEAVVAAMLAMPDITGSRNKDAQA
jgi:hypothetical protein